MLVVFSVAIRPCSSLFWDMSPRYCPMRQRRLSIPCVESLSAAETDERTMQSIPSQTSMFLSKRISHKLRHHGGHRCSNWSTVVIRRFRKIGDGNYPLTVGTQLSTLSLKEGTPNG